MAKGSEKSKKKKTVPVKADFVLLEKEALDKGNAALEAMERFLTEWDSASEKPDYMSFEVERIREFHAALSKWKKKTEKNVKGRQNEKQTSRNLIEFLKICWQYA